MNETISTMNIFMQYIYKKINMNFFNIIHYMIHIYKINKFKKEIHNGSPGFDVLWQMADFVKLSEMVFCYDNSIDNKDIGLYSSRNYQNGTNGFRIIEENYDITIKLFSKSKEVALEINRSRGEKLKTAISFKDNKWKDNHDKYDEMLLEQVIELINTKILLLFDYCYNARCCN